MHVWVDFGNRNDQNIVTENGVRLLTTQKPLKMQGQWKEKFASFWMLATGGVGCDRDGGLLMTWSDQLHLDCFKYN